MPNYTKNYNLEKPLETELYDVAVQNSNTDTLDTALKAVEDRVESTETSISLLGSGQLNNTTLTIGDKAFIGSARLIKNHNATADYGVVLEDVKDDLSTTRIQLRDGLLTLRFTKADGTSKTVTIGDARF